MIEALLVYILLGLIILTFPTRRSEAKDPIEIEKIVRKNCNAETVRCIDSCDFLCTDPDAKCVGSFCVTPENDPKIKCESKTGGMIVSTMKNGIRHWSCLCTDPTFYTGDDCSELAPDVCKNGSFHYFTGNSTCYCQPPYRKLVLNNKPYCVTKDMVRFFKL